MHETLNGIFHAVIGCVTTLLFIKWREEKMDLNVFAYVARNASVSTLELSGAFGFAAYISIRRLERRKLVVGDVYPGTDERGGREVIKYRVEGVKGVNVYVDGQT